VTHPEPIVTDDAGATLYRAMENDVQPCVWCGAGTWWTWLREDGPALRLLGFACSALCAERRERRPAT
jgi:hypothetical protein